MEAFGRMMAALISGSCIVLFLVFSQTASVHWQKNETVRSLSRAYVAEVLERGTVLRTEWEVFEAELRRLGEYTAELTVYERRRYEGEEGRVYLYGKWEEDTEEKRFSGGSYLRLTVTEKGRGNPETFLYGEGCTFIAGGRIS
ncbi:MAG: hypothetical protein PUC30_09910 [Lachnospiraceae bacterium]|nr:hypothetical protein [Lachnospiraceae bacterium]